MSDYGIRTRFDGSVEEAEAAITAALKEVGFGVLTRIDVAATLKNKLGIDMSPYVILGACNPQLAAHALQTEKEIGLLLPCNVIVYQINGETMVAAIEPAAMLAIVGRDDMQSLADDANKLLSQAIASVATAKQTQTNTAKEE